MARQNYKYIMQMMLKEQNNRPRDSLETTHSSGNMHALSQAETVTPKAASLGQPRAVQEQEVRHECFPTKS